MSTAPSRAWKFPTSPRSPYKIKPELKLLAQLQDRDWNKETQLAFAKLLSESSDYLGEVSEKETDFAARDRLRGPSTLGFIKKQNKAQTQLLLTDVGKIFVECELHEEEFIFQRQIAKVQFGSPSNNKNVEAQMNIRPMGLMIQILKEVGQLTKEEMALYCITTTDYKDIPATIQLIKQNREAISKEKDAAKRKALREKHRIDRLKQVYKIDLESGNTDLREGGQSFLDTKYRTLRDFADSSFRYFLATGLFSTNYHRQTFQLVNARMNESDFLLEQYGTKIDVNPKSDYATYIDSYLGNPEKIEIWRDSEVHQNEDAKRLIDFIMLHQKDAAQKLTLDYNHASNRTERLAVLNNLEHQSMHIHRVAESIKIRENLSMSYPDIKKTYEDIATLRNSMIDKPLMFEWNTWRLLNLFADNVSIVGNFLSDADGNPLRTASGGIADIVCEFKDFWLIVEVTLQTGMKQYETEGEPITRHVGNHIKKIKEKNDNRPVYGLFIAEKINSELLFYLNAISWRASQYYGGKIQIFPIPIEKLMSIMDATNLEQLHSQKLLNAMAKIFGDSLEKIGEIDWAEKGIEILTSEFSG